jgi:glutamine synthetase
MTPYKLEYIWLDGYEPIPNLRSKLQVKPFIGEPTLEEIPYWNFDGSSTRQAEGKSSDCILKPVALYPDPTMDNAYLVMCEVLMPDGTPHPSNTRASILDDSEAWFGFEQEYFLYQNGRPLGFPDFESDGPSTMIKLLLMVSPTLLSGWLGKVPPIARMGASVLIIYLISDYSTASFTLQLHGWPLSIQILWRCRCNSNL